MLNAGRQRRIQLHTHTELNALRWIHAHNEQETTSSKHEARCCSCIVRLMPFAFICSCISTIGRIEIQLCLCCSLCELAVGLGPHASECGCMGMCACVSVGLLLCGRHFVAGGGKKRITDAYF